MIAVGAVQKRGVVTRRLTFKTPTIKMKPGKLHTLIAFTVLATDLVAPSPAHAALGSTPTYSVSAHAAGATAQLAQASAAAASYTVNQTTLPSGTVVNEYVAANNTVFGLSWHGPTQAPLQTLLGSYFPAYIDGVTAAHTANGGGHGPVAVHQSALVVETGGHMGAFVGRAYLPQALPQGVSADDIK
jgi:hypothetical protein